MKKASGNMYPFIDYTWNPVRGECPYKCSYCYTFRWGKLPPLHLGKNNFIFICSGCDLFHPNIPDDWIYKTIEHTIRFPDNRYLLHTKNPGRALLFQDMIHNNYIFCITVESDIDHGLTLAPPPLERLKAAGALYRKKMITVEPILKFTSAFAEKIMSCNPVQINIGADSGNNNLPEPEGKDIEQFLRLFNSRFPVVLKPNLQRIYSGGDYERTN